MVVPFKISPDECAKELLAAGLASTVPNALSTEKKEFTTDSRQLKAGGVFLAYSGVSFNSHSVLDQVANDRPALIIHEQEFSHASIPCIRVKNARAAWAQVASAAYGHPGAQLKLIGVTGTNGKTSTVHFIKQILEKKCATLGTLGAFIGDKEFATTHTTPDPPELYRFLHDAVQSGVQYVAMEVSSHALVQEKLFPLTFDTVVFTSFARDHLDLHGSVENYWQAKVRLFTERTSSSSLAILCTRINDISNLASQLTPHLRDIWYYGHKDDTPSPKACIDHVTYEPHQTIITGRFFGQPVRLQTRLIGNYTFENLLAALLVKRAVTGNDVVSENLLDVTAPPGRLELVKIKDQDPNVFVDYSHTPDAIESALKALRPATKGKLWIVFGCGGNRDAGKRPLMMTAACEHADYVILTSDNPRFEAPDAIINDTIKGKRPGAKVYTQADRRSAIEMAIVEAHQNDTILIAGKGHETYMEIQGMRHHFDDRDEARSALKLRG